MVLDIGYSLDMGWGDVVHAGHGQDRWGTVWTWPGQMGYCLDTARTDGVLSGHGLTLMTWNGLHRCVQSEHGVER